MAQLSDDCFAFGGPLLPLGDALEMLGQRVPIVADIESRPLRACLGRVLRKAVIAAIAVPAHDNAAVDGYAVRFEDLNPEGDTLLPVTGRAAAGHPLNRRAKAGEAIRIFTGAPMPEGADTIMMQEDCRRDGEQVVIRPGIKRGANRRLAGEDIEKDSEVLPLGRRLRPWDLGLAASVGCAELSVSRPLRVAILSTGDELAEPGAARGDGQVYDANRNSVAGLLRTEGCQVSDLGILADRHDLIRETLAEAAKRHDLVISNRRRLRRRRGSRQGGPGGSRWLALFLAPGDQAGAAGGVGSAGRHRLRRPARKPGGLHRHLRCPGAPL